MTPFKLNLSNHLPPCMLTVHNILLRKHFAAGTCNYYYRDICRFKKFQGSNIDRSFQLSPSLIERNKCRLSYTDQQITAEVPCFFLTFMQLRHLILKSRDENNFSKWNKGWWHDRNHIKESRSWQTESDSFIFLN